MEQTELIRQAGRGSADVFYQLTQDSWAAVYRNAALLACGREYATELTYNTYIRAWHAISLYPNNTPFSLWLERILFQTYVDMEKKKSAAPKSLLSLTLSEPESACMHAFLREKPKNRSLLAFSQLHEGDFSHAEDVLDLDAAACETQLPAMAFYTASTDEALNAAWAAIYTQIGTPDYSIPNAVLEATRSDKRDKSAVSFLKRIRFTLLALVIVAIMLLINQCQGNRQEISQNNPKPSITTAEPVPAQLHPGA